MSNAPETAFASKEAREIFDVLSEARTRDQLERLQKQVYARWGAGAISDDDAGRLGELIQGRLRAKSEIGRPAVQALRKPRMRSLFPEKRRRPAPDRAEAIRKRRVLSGSGAMPANIRECYSQAIAAVLTVIALCVKERGHCDLSVDEIMDRTGVCRTTVQNALRLAQANGHIELRERPQRGAKHLSNIIRIKLKGWLDWLGRGSRKVWGIGLKTLSATKILRPLERTEKKEEEASEGGGAGDYHLCQGLTPWRRGHREHRT